MAFYILVNQNNEILNKQLQWNACCPANEAFISPNRDVVLNQLIELNSNDIDLRAKVEKCAADKNGLPILPTMTASSTQQVA